MTSVSLVHRSLLCGVVLVGALTAQCGPYVSNEPPPPSTWTPSNSNGSQPGSPSAPSPAGPSSPGPAGPSAPAPETPDKGGPATPRGPAAGRPSGPRTGGIAISFERGETAKDRLRVDWLHPVPPARAAVGTQAAGPLPLNEALAVLWESDPRPLLVLRECNQCTGSDDALLSRSLKNDRTLLMTKWFRTVRLPQHVVESTHPFYRLFQTLANAHGTPHVFLLAHPGADPVCFSGAQTQTQLWKAMFDVIGQRYLKDPAKALKEWLSVLDAYDTIDARRLQLQEQLNGVRATDGPESQKAKRLTESLAKLQEERQVLSERETKARDLYVLPMPKLVSAATK